MQEGWFDHHMPDLNQKNPFVQNYLIQNHIWWIEFAGIDGVRLDTYPYNDPVFMAVWAQRIKLEFPELSIFGETVVSTVPSQAFFTQGNTVNRGFETHLPGVTDIMLRSAIFEALNGSEGWNDGINRLYITLSLDFLYQDAGRNVVFLDNHDVSRLFSMVGEDISKFRCGIVLLLTLRGIPQLYYGTEILMRNFAEPDGMVRSDFPGGWPGDITNKFLASGRNDQENEAFNFIKILANYRKTNEVLQTGKLMQFVPVNHIYVYFRYNCTAAVMIIINNNDTAADVNTTRFKERIGGFKKLHDIIHNTVFDLTENLFVATKTTLVYELLH
jgi:glycosidase